MDDINFDIRNIRKPWYMLIWLLATQVLVAFVGRSLAPLSVFIGVSLALTNTQIGMLPAALFFGQFLASIPAGILVDRWDTRPFLIILTLGMGVSFFLAAFTTNFILLILFIVIGGISYGAMHPVTNRGIFHWFPHQSRGIAMGIKQMGITAGSALAVLLLVPLAEIYSWRLAIIVAISFLILVGFVSFMCYRDKTADYDNDVKSKKKFTMNNIITLLKNQHLIVVSVGAMVLNCAQMCVNTYIILYSTLVLNVPLYLAAILLVISEIGGAIGRIGWGVLSDRAFGGNRIILMSLISLVSAVSLSTLATFNSGIPFFLVVILVFIIGLCISGFNGLWMNAATELVPSKQVGIASGVSISLGSWGVIIGPPLFGYVIDVTGSFTAGWFALSLTLLIVAALFLQQHIQLTRYEKSPL